MSDASARLRPRSRTEPDLRLPDELETSRSKLVYLALAIAGEATVEDLQQTLGLSKLTLLPVLGNLRDRDLVERTDRGYAVASSRREGYERRP